MSKEDIKKAKAENAERIANIAYSGGGHIQLLKMVQNGASIPFGMMQVKSPNWEN